jgi:hypothetical protein
MIKSIYIKKSWHRIDYIGLTIERFAICIIVIIPHLIGKIRNFFTIDGDRWDVAPGSLLIKFEILKKNPQRTSTDRNLYKSVDRHLNAGLFHIVYLLR